jgi:hypothetical protein
MISDIFKTMLSQPEPWNGNINDVDNRKKRELINIILVSYNFIYFLKINIFVCILDIYYNIYLIFTNM